MHFPVWLPVFCLIASGFFLVMGDRRNTAFYGAAVAAFLGGFFESMDVPYAFILTLLTAHVGGLNPILILFSIVLVFLADVFVAALSTLAFKLVLPG